MNYNLKGKIAIITGASRGIGKAIAHALAEAGADIAISSRKLPELEETANEIKTYGHKVLAITAHMGKLDDIKNLIASTLKEFKKIDILINNAATNPIFGPTLDVTEEAWDKILDVNLKGYFFASLLSAKEMMKQKWGKIINITSTAGLRPMPGLGVYSISKAGVIMLTKVCAREWGANGIRVNAIAPGVVETRFSRLLWETPEIRDEVIKMTPLGKIGKSDDIKGLIQFLASEASDFITGEVISIDGGAVI